MTLRRVIPGERQPEAFNIPGGRKTEAEPPSIWRYGSGAKDEPQSLPPIVRLPTSAPSGAAETSNWLGPVGRVPGEQEKPGRSSHPDPV